MKKLDFINKVFKTNKKLKKESLLLPTKPSTKIWTANLRLWVCGMAWLFWLPCPQCWKYLKILLLLIRRVASSFILLVPPYCSYFFRKKQQLSLLIIITYHIKWSISLKEKETSHKCVQIYSNIIDHENKHASSLFWQQSTIYSYLPNKQEVSFIYD